VADMADTMDIMAITEPITIPTTRQEQATDIPPHYRAEAPRRARREYRRAPQIR
jgi:hypothetical protein